MSTVSNALVSPEVSQHLTAFPLLSVPASSGAIDGKDQIEKEEKSPFGQRTWHKFRLFQLTHPAVFYKLSRGTS